MDEKPYIDFDIDRIDGLRESYLWSMEEIQRHIPQINLKKSTEIKRFFKEYLAIELENVKINQLLEHMECYDHDSPEFDAINGIVMYLRLKFSVLNYLNNILKHHENGRVYLRLHQGEWVLPNKRPIPLNPEIRECIVHFHKGEKYGSNNECW